ncbi:diguanylate cyclase [Sedimentibacter hydroxybenzoicus DSM 7310]|uniref:Diguanylate cyclase n=1 Tax=Sedimentibacter hydroxybenzoicus DSM 7310 TaxID=1123245 RepID=A0A974GVB9_SEDHY|nr:HD domain-containing phosphohydrolase [Sedimentibacter hydroxybenzoicus]NYB72940.1 diguanylate cyclase [Sedimentibacter hydroxybenzoicus DSM 7310]
MTKNALLNRQTYTANNKYDFDENSYKSLFLDLPIGYAFFEIIYDENNKPYDYKFIEVNSIFEEKSGLKSKELIGENISVFFECIDNKKTEQLMLHAARAIYKGKQQEFEIYNKHVNKWYKIHLKAPSRKFLVTYLIDITKEKLHTIELENARRRMENIIEATDIGTWELNMQTGERIYNERWASILGYTLEELSPINEDTWIGLVHPDDLQQELNKDMLLYNKKIDCYDDEYRMRHKDGHWVWIQDRGKVISWTEDGSPLLLSGTHTDITAKRNKQEEVLYLSYRDQLTGFYNRRYFDENLKEIDVEKNLPMSVILADVNGLKLTNDSFGHSVGDDLLKKATDVIRAGCCRNTDKLVRIGGDEFLIILPNTESWKAVEIIKNINSLALKEKVRGIDVSISFGYKTKRRIEESFNDVFKSAEARMYRHKLYESSCIRNKTIEIIMNTLYEKSNREMLHSKRVGEICEKIALRLNFDKEKTIQVKLAGIMHDIGKMGIDENILNKPQRLSYEEYNELKRHPEIGYRMLSTSNDYSEIADYVLKHHERWDGNGYPGGFKGEEISIQARIIAIAEAYDDMIYGMPYKKNMSIDEAAAELKRCSGSQFDPDIVEVFIDLITSP